LGVQKNNKSVVGDLATLEWESAFPKKKSEETLRGGFMHLTKVEDVDARWQQCGLL